MRDLHTLQFGATTQDEKFALEPGDLVKVVVIIRDQDDNTLLERTFDPDDVLFDEVQLEDGEWWNAIINIPIPMSFDYRGYLKYEVGYVPKSGPAWFEVPDFQEPPSPASLEQLPACPSLSGPITDEPPQDS